MSQDPRIFGIPLNKGVKDQLELRQKVVGDDHDENLPNGIDSRHRMLYNSRGAWIRVTSSVNVLDEEIMKYEGSVTIWRDQNKNRSLSAYYGQTASDAINNYRKALNNKTNVLARNNVLEGGVIAFNYGDDKKIRGKRREKVNLSQTDGPYGVDSIYASTPDTGFKPMMGITDLKVKSKSTYGSLREMEIGIVAHTQEQISVLENLYFRPGFDMLLEFGNAAYLDKKGKVTNRNYGLSSAFLRGVAKEKILDRIDKDKKESGYNYEGLLGKVINFSWDLKTDGSYDCTLKLITSGEVMESISTIKYDSKTHPSRKKLSGKDPSSDLLLNFLKSCRSLVYADSQKEWIEKINTRSNTELKEALEAEEITAEEAEQRKKETLEKAPLTIEQVERTYGIHKNILNTNTFTSQWRYVKKEGTNAEGKRIRTTRAKGFTVYISLVGLAHCLNKLFVDGLTDSKEKPITRFGTDPKVSKYVTFSENISNNPYFFGKPYDEGPGELDISPKQLYGAEREGAKDGVDAPRECRVAYTRLSRGFPNSFSMHSPYFLFVSFDYLISVQRAFLDEKKNNDDKIQSIFSFYKKVLRDVSTAFGNISKLDLHLDSSSQKWIIIDRNLYEPVTKKKDMPVLNLIGKNSIVTNFSLNSKISSKLASMLSIASSASGTGAGIEGLFKFNEGLVDRYEEVPDYSEVETDAKFTAKEEMKKNRKSAIDKISSTYTEYLKNIAVEDTFSSMTSDHTFYMKHTRSLIKNDKSTSTGKPRSYDGLIPIDLSFTLEGMTGFRPGEAFVVGGNVLPKRYQGIVGFVITQVEHNIGDDNKWDTDIRTKMFMLPDVDTEKLLDNDSPLGDHKKDKNSNSKLQKNLKATYGEPGDTSILTSVKVPVGYKLTYLGRPVKNIRIHKDIAENLKNALIDIKTEYGSEKIKALNLNIYQGSFNDRHKINGSTKSTHAWGIALDFDADNNKLEWGPNKAAFAKNKEYKNFLQIFKKYGFYNLGTEKKYDYMHFQAWDPNQPE